MTYLQNIAKGAKRIFAVLLLQVVLFGGFFATASNAIAADTMPKREKMGAPVYDKTESGSASALKGNERNSLKGDVFSTAGDVKSYAENGEENRSVSEQAKNAVDNGLSVFKEATENSLEKLNPNSEVSGDAAKFFDLEKGRKAMDAQGGR